MSSVGGVDSLLHEFLKLPWLRIEESLQRFRLRVSGGSGCNRWMEGKPAKAKGSSASPPTAKPTR
jgi:hypothetical protein